MYYYTIVSVCKSSVCNCSWGAMQLCDYTFIYIYNKCMNMDWFKHAIMWVYWCVSNSCVCMQLFGYAITWVGNCVNMQFFEFAIAGWGNFVCKHYSPRNKVGEIQKRKFHVINFGLIFCPSWGTMMRANILLEF